MFPLTDASSCSPLPSSGSCGISAHSSPFSSVLPVRTHPPPPSRFVSGLLRLALLASHFLLARKAEVFPKILGNPSVSKCYFASDTEMISSSFRATMWRFAYAGWDQFTAPNSRRFPELEVGLISWARLIS